MERKKIVSSNINSVGYDGKSQTLEVEFYDNAVYQYTPVTEEAYNQMMGAKSIGSYFSQKIKNASGVTTTKMKG